MAISLVGYKEAGATNGNDPSCDLTALVGGSNSAPSEDDVVIAVLGIGDNDDVDFTMARRPDRSRRRIVGGRP